MNAGTNASMYNLVREVLAMPAPRRWSRRILGISVLLALAWGGAPSDDAAPASAGVRAVASEPVVTALQARAERAEYLWTRVEAYYKSEIAPIAQVLVRYRDDVPLARRVAAALVREARRVDVDPYLLLSVLLVENPWLDPTARSSVGAVGLMQVMPFHRGNWPPCKPDLEEIESNICHGAQIFAHTFRQEGGDLERALLRYNGCVDGVNTPDCHRYPFKVFALAGRASLQAWLRPRSAVQTGLTR